MIAQQGHTYDYQGGIVLVMEPGENPMVSYIDPSWEWCSPPFRVDGAELSPRPMKYFHGEVPK